MIRSRRKIRELRAENAELRRQLDGALSLAARATVQKVEAKRRLEASRG